MKTDECCTGNPLMLHCFLSSLSLYFERRLVEELQSLLPWQFVIIMGYREAEGYTTYEGGGG